MIRICVSLLAAALSLCAADVTGRWTAKVAVGDGTQEIILNFKADGARLTGTIVSDRGDTEILEGKVAGEELSFIVRSDSEQYNVKGKVSGAEIRFSAERDGGERVAEFTAHRAE
jgi:hypothetical protein